MHSAPYSIHIIRRALLPYNSYPIIVKIPIIPCPILTFHASLCYVPLCLVNQSQKCSYLYFSDRFDNRRNSVWCHINRKSVIIIKIWFRLTRFRKKKILYTCILYTRNHYMVTQLFMCMCITEDNLHILRLLLKNSEQRFQQIPTCLTIFTLAVSNLMILTIQQFG